MKIQSGSLDAKKLLRNKKVIEEINRHKWLESEIAGYDIGFEAATEDWLKKHASVWVAYHAGKKSALGLSPADARHKPKKNRAPKPVHRKKKH
ncbi:MAG: hypothetical protein KGJ09_08650 [Candidatus Omnitrophica bacterium]|nr:hypothetical protein [Candidatus Omnitrophota bacterium]MDE2010131.1 hypothetical protein [Candidatus Omnitrophota bacterium]MDE2214318.1 hypothetical protein [Candidatus Omnitrophota bacterium]MDE2231067.1 hypothetical protein [Candidatus Omnitrophota bacterium]